MDVECNSIYSESSLVYELSFGTSFDKVDLLGAMNNCSRQTDTETLRKFINGIYMFSNVPIIISILFLN